MGPEVAAHAVPVSERAGTVTVACRDSVWSAELELQSRTLIERLALVLASSEAQSKVAGLRFVVAPLEGS